MKAVVISRFGGPDVLKYVDFETPQAGPDNICVKVEAIGVHAADAMWREGTYPYKLPDPPFVPGQIASGKVCAVGENVENFAVGQAVHVLHLPGGAYAEYMAVPPGSVIALPDGIDPVASCCITEYIATWAFLSDGLHGQDVRSVFLPNATGGVGMATIQCAKVKGYKIIGSASTKDGCDSLLEWGADHAINHNEEDVTQRILEFTGQRGADLIMDHLGGNKVIEQFSRLAENGMLFQLNIITGAPETGVFELMRSSPEKAFRVRSWSTHVYDRHPKRRQELTDDVVKLMARGDFRPSRLNIMPLEKASDAHAMREQRLLPGKTILIP